MTIQLEDLLARALFYEFSDTEGASWALLPESDRAGWRRVAEYVEKLAAEDPQP